jgi:hypothetical protein
MDLVSGHWSDSPQNRFFGVIYGDNISPLLLRCLATYFSMATEDITSLHSGSTDVKYKKTTRWSKGRSERVEYIQ